MAGSKMPRLRDIDHVVARLLEDPATARLVALRLRAGLVAARRAPPPHGREADIDEFWDNMPV